MTLHKIHAKAKQTKEDLEKRWKTAWKPQTTIEDQRTPLGNQKQAKGNQKVSQQKIAGTERKTIRHWGTFENH